MPARSLLPIEDARRLVLAETPTLPGEAVPVAPEALGRALAEEVLAAEPVPAFDSSAMDGFAVRAADLSGAAPEDPALLRLAGESRAGGPAARELRAGEAFAISTGAMVPAGADAVVRVEDTRRDGDGVAVLVQAPPGQDVRHAGDDIQPGLRVLAAGTELGPAELGVLASLGRAEVLCARRPRVSVVVTGDELLGPGEPMRPGAIRDSNSFTIPALAARAGAEVTQLGRVPDEPGAVREAIAQALTADVAVVCGGVSVGEHDHVKPALAALGARETFWGIALRPGKPTWFGTSADTLVFGLPGNPVSSMVTFALLVRPALRAMSGLSPGHPAASAVLDGGYEKPAGRAYAIRVQVDAREDGWHARPMKAQGSHVLTSMLGADALALIPAETERVLPGERVRLEPLDRWPGGWHGGG